MLKKCPHCPYTWTDASKGKHRCFVYLRQLIGKMSYELPPDSEFIPLLKELDLWRM